MAGFQVTTEDYRMSLGQYPERRLADEATSNTSQSGSKPTTQICLTSSMRRISRLAASQLANFWPVAQNTGSLPAL
jgi:hypothetical protein